MAARRIDAGIYEVNGKRVYAKTAAEAQKKAGTTKQSNTKTQTKAGPQNPVQRAGDFTDPTKVAQSQIDLNRLNEANPYGSRTFDPTTGAVTDALTPGQQGVLDAQQRTGGLGANIAGGLLGAMPQQYDANSLNQYLPQGSDQARQQSYDATYGMLTRDLQKNKARDQQAIEQRLADQGIPVGSKLYNDQMQQFNQGYADQELQARNQATLTGNQAFQQNFDMGQQNYTNRFGAYQSNYSMPAAISGQLQGLYQVQQPTFGQGIAGIDLSGFYDAEVGRRLKQQELAIANRAAGGGGRSGGSGGQSQGFIPSMGGVAGAGGQTQPARPGIVQTLGNSVAQGIATGAANNLMR